MHPTDYIVSRQRSWTEACLNGCQQLFGKPNCGDVSGPAQSVKLANLIPVVIEREEDCETHYTYAMTTPQHPLLSICNVQQYQHLLDVTTAPSEDVMRQA